MTDIKAIKPGLADRLWIMEAGPILRLATPADLDLLHAELEARAMIKREEAAKDKAGKEE